jgi:hypothetical protein
VIDLRTGTMQNYNAEAKALSATCAGNRLTLSCHRSAMQGDQYKVFLTYAKEVDKELVGWLKQAYREGG